MNTVPVQSEITVKEALEVFKASANSPGGDQRILGHLLDVQALIGDELQWVQDALDEVSRDGVSPATEAAHHLVSRGGKRVRPLLVMLAASAFGSVTDATRTVALVSEVVHTATLLHDDVTDDGMERRGAATSRRLWGNAVSVLAGDLLLVHAISRTLADVPSIVAGLLGTLREMVDGEVLQLRGRTELLISDTHYHQVARGKTASLFAWAARSGALTGGAATSQAEAMARFGEKLGLAFQMVDDVLDFVGTDTGKTSLADLREGKVSLPLVYAVQRCPEIIQDLRAIHAGDLAPVDSVAQRVVDSGACDEVRILAKRLTQEAVTALNSIGNSAPVRLLEGVARDLVSRIG